MKLLEKETDKEMIYVRFSCTLNNFKVCKFSNVSKSWWMYSGESTYVLRIIL